MRKKIIIISALVLVFVGLFYVLYNKFTPNSQSYAAKLHDDNQLTTENLTQYLQVEPGKHVFYLDDGSSDAQYVSSSLLIPLSLEFENALPEIEPIVFNDNQLSVVGMKKTYSVESLPAFVIVQTKDESGSYDIVSSLSYNKEQPFDAKELRTWFHENGLWNAPFASAN